MDYISPAEGLELFQLMADARTTNYFAGNNHPQEILLRCPVAAAVTVLVLEHISTFQEEVNHFRTRLGILFKQWSSHVERGETICGLDIVREIAKIHIYLDTVAVSPDNNDNIWTSGKFMSSTCSRYINSYEEPFYQGVGLYHLVGTRFQRMPVVILFLRDGVFLFMTIMRKTIDPLNPSILMIEFWYTVLAIPEIVIWSKGRPSLAQIPII
ncbi:hypothetical protein B0H17DRAFT_1125177 [Mycena rosella]|uniref:Uncharacterized protein n=1 Tax=Mycena rosella TaxID=1033263 RepID=A0AAD7M9X0_MYCRO|nr:hypothetical protein B0H17DRAFT_1125177 [Mycena rosella]